MALRSVCGLMLGGVALASMASAAQAQAPVSSGTSDASGQDVAVAEVVVTANKRNELAKNVPSAITTLGADTIRTQGIEDFRDYATLVPGLSQRDAGQPGTGTIILRGLNSGTQQTSSTAAFYLDEAQFTPSGYLSTGGILTPDPDLGDIERIEVLKGPQGTLYGANNLGGVIRVISAKPDTHTYSGTFRVEGTAVDGGDAGYSVRGSINAPLIEDKLAVRASGFYRETPGFADNLGTGRKNVNTSDLGGGRISLLAKPTEKLTIELTGVYQDIDNVGLAGQDNRADSLIPRTRNYEYSTFADLPSRINYRIGSGTASYDFGPVSWITTATFGRFTSSLQSDLTTAYLPLLAGAYASAGVNTATLGLLGDIGPNTDKWTVESRLVSRRLGRFEFITGIYYTNEDSSYATTIESVNRSTLRSIGGPFAEVFRAATLSKYEEIAGFGNLTYYIRENIDVTGGVRYSHNEDNSTTGAPLNGIPASSFFRPRAQALFQASEDPVTFLATLRWRPTPNLSTYFRAASGYRPGGPQTNIFAPAGTPNVTSDSTVNYEGGLKGTLYAGRLSFELSGYHIDWSDIQLNSLLGGTILGVNGGAATVDGAEATISARPMKGLTVAASFGYTDAKLTQISAGASASIGAVAGDSLPLTPKETFSLSADQIVPLTPTLSATFGGTLRVQSDMPTGFPGDPLNPNIQIPAYAVFGLRAGLNWDRYTLQIRGDNLGNEIGFTTIATNRVFAGQVVPANAVVTRPRSVTVSLSARF